MASPLANRYHARSLHGTLVASAAVETVRKAVTKPTNGVKVALKEPELTQELN